MLTCVWLLLLFGFAYYFSDLIEEIWEYWRWGKISRFNWTTMPPWEAIIGLAYYNLLIGIFIGSVFPHDHLVFLLKVDELTFLQLVPAALKEELFFRGLPIVVSWCVHRWLRRDTYRMLGAISSVIFGLLHLGNFAGWTWVDFPVVLPQTISGFIYFWTARKYGLQWAFAAHLLFNTVILVLARLG